MGKIVPLQKNLLHSFKRKYVDAYSLQCHLKRHPETKRIIGCLPFDWLKRLPKDEFSKVTKEVDTVFSEFSILHLDRERCHAGEMAKFMDRRLEKALKKILHREDIYVNLEGNGSYKCCRKITVGDYSYALSTFLHDSERLYADTPKPTHGPKIEPQTQFFAYKNYSHGRIAKPFMAKLGTGQNLDGSYILMQYIDKNYPVHSKPKGNILRDCVNKLHHNDVSENNQIHGIFVDIGGMKLNSTRVDDKEFKNNLFILFDRIYKEFTRKNSKTIHPLFKRYENRAESFLISEIQNGTDIYSTDLRQLLKPLTNPEEKLAAIKMVRRMRNMHNLLVKLKKSGKFEYDSPYCEYLNKVKTYQTFIVQEEINRIKRAIFY